MASEQVQALAKVQGIGVQRKLGCGDPAPLPDDLSPQMAQMCLTKELGLPAVQCKPPTPGSPVRGFISSDTLVLSCRKGRRTWGKQCESTKTHGRGQWRTWGRSGSQMCPARYTVGPSRMAIVLHEPLEFLAGCLFILFWNVPGCSGMTPDLTTWEHTTYVLITTGFSLGQWIVITKHRSTEGAGHEVLD